MSHCCQTPTKRKAVLARIACPANHQLGRQVSLVTVMHQVAAPWTHHFSDTDYAFCADPDCDVVYFSACGSTITRAQLRPTIKVKGDDATALLCYCFGVTKEDYAQNPALKQFVLEQTKLKRCACEVKNPSGRCCLNDFANYSLT